MGPYIRQIDGTDIKWRIHCSPRDSTWGRKWGKTWVFKYSSFKLMPDAAKEDPQIYQNYVGSFWIGSHLHFDPPMMIRNAWNSPKITLHISKNIRSITSHDLGSPPFLPDTPLNARWLQTESVHISQSWIKARDHHQCMLGIRPNVTLFLVFDVPQLLPW